MFTVKQQDSAEALAPTRRRRRALSAEVVQTRPRRRYALTVRGSIARVRG